MQILRAVPVLSVLVSLGWALAGPIAAAAETAEKDVLEVLRRYETAMETKDLIALKEVWPRIRKVKSEAKTISMSFSLTRELKLELEVSSIEIADGKATADCIRRDEIALTNGQIFKNESFVRFHLRLAGGSWLIESLEDFEGTEIR